VRLGSHDADRSTTPWIACTSSGISGSSNFGVTVRCAGWNGLCRLGREGVVSTGQGWSRALLAHIPDLSIQHERLRSVGCTISRSIKVMVSQFEGVLLGPSDAAIDL
jgi:hypothetical protein